MGLEQRLEGLPPSDVPPPRDTPHASDALHAHILDIRDARRAYEQRGRLLAQALTERYGIEAEYKDAVLLLRLRPQRDHFEILRGFESGERYRASGFDDDGRRYITKDGTHVGSLRSDYPDRIIYRFEFESPASGPHASREDDTLPATLAGFLRELIEDICGIPPLP